MLDWKIEYRDSIWKYDLNTKQWIIAQEGYITISFYDEKIITYKRLPEFIPRKGNLRNICYKTKDEFGKCKYYIGTESYNSLHINQLMLMLNNNYFTSWIKDMLSTAKDWNEFFYYCLSDIISPLYGIKDAHQIEVEKEPYDYEQYKTSAN